MTNKEYNDFEKELFNFAKNDKDVPLYVDKSINNAFERINASKKTYSMIYKLRRVAVVILCLGFITTGIVFAKEIVNFVKSLFTNSTPGIEAAVENGLVQSIDMDFIYNNGIGIKVDNILMNDTVLDIAFEYDIPKNYNNIKKINIAEYEITDENNNIIIKLFKNNNYYEVSSDSISDNYQDMNAELNGNYYKNSILLKSNNKYTKSEKLKFNITSIYIIDDKNKKTDILGEWTFEIDLNNNSLIDNYNVYNKINNPDVLNINTYLNEITYVVEIELAEEIDSDILHDIGNIILKDSIGKTYEIASISTLKNKISIEFDYGKFNVEDKLILYIKYSEDKELNINL